MKQIMRIIFVFCLFAGIFYSADAQRRTGENASEVRRTMPTGIARTPHAQSNVREHSVQRTENSGSTGLRMPARTFQQPQATSQQRNVTLNSTPRSRTSIPRTTEPRDVVTPVENNVATAAPQRNIVPRTSSQSNVSGNQNNMARNNVQRNLSSNQRITPGTRTSSTYDNSNYRNSNYRYNNNRSNYYYNRNNYYRANYVYRPVFMYGPRYRTVPRSWISIYFGGNPFYYTDGFYYGYYGGYYEPVFPPFGLRISTLPFGYSRFYIGVNPFFYFNGIYYRQYNDNSYEVIDAPMGATVSSLPKGAKSVVVNGEKLYELNGTYYKADRDSKGRDIYIVVGKNGEINNTTEETQNESSSSLQNGDVINSLPDGSKVVTINGQKLYVTPDETYLQEETNNGVVQYKVVGK